MFKSQEAEIKELRAQFEHFRGQRGEAGQDGASDSVRKESVVEKDWSMEEEDEVESRKKLDDKRKRLQRQLR